MAWGTPDGEGLSDGLSDGLGLRLGLGDSVKWRNAIMGVCMEWQKTMENSVNQSRHKYTLTNRLARKLGRI